jgi:cytochrome c-type biogenesis protein CcsB
LTGSNSSNYQFYIYLHTISQQQHQMNTKQTNIFHKIIKASTSMPAIAILTTLIIIALASATFIEYYHSTAVAKALIYESILFEIAVFYYAIILIINLFKKDFFQKKKWSTILFHFSILFILLGAGITRYFAQEGTVRIRENKTINSILSRDNYVEIEINDGSNIHNITTKTNITKFSKKNLTENLTIANGNIKIQSIDYIPNAQAQFIQAQDGVPAIFLLFDPSNQAFEIPLMQGDYLKTNQISISCNKAIPADINIRFHNQEIYFRATHDVEIRAKNADTTTYYPPGDSVPLSYDYLYIIKGIDFVMSNYMPSIELNYITTDDPMYQNYNIVQFQIDYNNETEHFYLPQQNNTKGEKLSMEIAGAKIDFSYGAKEIPLPFTLTLNDFILETYSGSQSPSAFISKIKLQDKENNYTSNEEISMNNVLQYQGYRFYQSSYDKDLKGTILSVNYDPWGIRITYIGYFLLFIGIVLSLLNPHSIFQKRIKSLRKKTFILLLFTIFTTTTLSAQNQGSATEPVNKEVATEFGKILVQDHQGRIKPINTFSLELIRKISAQTSYLENNADQFHLGMLMQPEAWQHEAIFHVKNPEIKEYLEMQGEHISFYDFFLSGNPDLYKLKPLLDEAYSKPVDQRNKMNKEVIDLDERVNIFLMIQSGLYLRVFPHPTYDTLPWLTPIDNPQNMKPIDSLFLREVFPIAIQSLYKGETTTAKSMFEGIQEYQEKYGGDAIPTRNQIKAEIFYNTYRPFGVLAIAYALLGIFLLALVIYHRFKQDKIVQIGIHVFKYTLVLAALIHLLAFSMRWYIGGHPPFSSGYESILFVSLSIILVSMFFIRKQVIVMAIAAIMSALSLLVAHLSWMNPEITNLIPVLQSPWLTIHVAVIMIAYALFGITVLISFTNILLANFLLEQNKKRIKTFFDELSLINKIILTPAVYLLAAGCFLGAIWANEAWGRYWSWDPKETWTLITILVYSVLAHAQYIKALKNNYIFNVFTLFAFSFILMTYFGVNYFLGGMHSYAGGEMQALPRWWWFVLSVIVLLVAYGGYKYRMFFKEKSKKED